MPKVSIILTSFNHEKYLREAIDSALNQSFDDFECIIWDDASTDNSWEIICSYTDARIIAHRNVQNFGGGNINRALKIAKGEYIAIHHSDDVWMLDKLAKQVAFLDEHSDIGAVFTWAQIIDECNKNIDVDWFNVCNKSRWQWLYELFIGENHLNHPSVMVRKLVYDRVGTYRYGLSQMADAEMWSRILMAYPIHVLSERLVLHRLFSNKLNTSACRPDVAVRLRNEWNFLLENFLAVENVDDFFKIFPQLSHYELSKEGDIKFLMAMACIYEGGQKNAQQLGIRWLYEIIYNEEHRRKIQDIYGFTLHDLLQISGKYDVYSSVSDLKNIDLRERLTICESNLIQKSVSDLKDIDLRESLGICESNLSHLYDLYSSVSDSEMHLKERLSVCESNLSQKSADLQNVSNELYALKQTRLFRMREVLLFHPPSARKLIILARILVGGLIPKALRAYLPLQPARLGRAFNDESGVAYHVRLPSAPPSNAPRVVHVIANFMIGGSSRLVIDLVEYLGDRYQQSVLTSFNPKPPAYIGISIEECRCKESVKPFIDYYRRIQPDFVHVHYWGDCDESWYAKAIEAAEMLSLPVIENINTPIEPFRSQAVAKYIYVSDYVRSVFGEADAHHVTIYPGSDFNLFTRVRHERAPEDCVGMVYRLERDKLNEDSIQPFIRIAQLRPRTKVLIVGGGSLYEPFKAAVQAAGVAENFEFTGYVSYDALPDLYSRMSLFVVPVWKESFGQVSPFAMSMKVPVVGYDVGAIKEIIGTSELVAPAGDAEALARIAVRLLDAPQESQAIGEAQQQRAHAHFSVQAMIDHYAQIYAEVILKARKDSL